MTKNILLAIASVATLVTMGAGCSLSPTPTPDTQSVTTPTASISDSSLTPTSTPVTATPPPSSNRPRVLVAAKTDETWKLYTNKALGYSVNTPTRGKYTPFWEMKYVDQNDGRMNDGSCYKQRYIHPDLNNNIEMVVAQDGTEFCHTRNENGGAGSNFEANADGLNFVVDDYATALGKKFIVIEFTKRTADASVVGCAGKMTEPYSVSETTCIPFVASEYQATLDGIMGTFKMNAASNSITAATPREDLEKSIVREKNELFRTYYATNKELYQGYPVIFANTTNPSVRFASLVESGGDAAHTTQYFVNQSKDKMLQVDTDVYGGDFGDSGKLTLALKDGSTAVIERIQSVDYEKREITYKGLRVNNIMVLTFNDLIWKPEGALEFTVLGVTPDLTRVYFSDGLKQYAYDIVNERLQEINEFPSFVAKPI